MFQEAGASKTAFPSGSLGTDRKTTFMMDDKAFLALHSPKKRGKVL
jgi:hypothetical protein